MCLTVGGVKFQEVSQKVNPLCQPAFGSLPSKRTQEDKLLEPTASEALLFPVTPLPSPAPPSEAPIPPNSGADNYGVSGEE